MRICPFVVLRRVRVNRIQRVAGRRRHRVSLPLRHFPLFRKGFCQVFFLGMSIIMVQCRPWRQGTTSFFRRLRAQLGRTGITAGLVSGSSLSTFTIFQHLRNRQAMNANGRASPISVNCRGRVHVNVAHRKRVCRIHVLRISFQSATHSFRRRQVMAN